MSDNMTTNKEARGTVEGRIEDIARNAVKVSIFIGLASVLLFMLNIAILLTQITATAGIDRKIKTIESQIASISSIIYESDDRM